MIEEILVCLEVRIFTQHMASGVEWSFFPLKIQFQKPVMIY